MTRMSLRARRSCKVWMASYNNNNNNKLLIVRKLIAWDSFSQPRSSIAPKWAGIAASVCFSNRGSTAFCAKTGSASTLYLAPDRSRKERQICAPILSFQVWVSLDSLLSVDEWFLRLLCLMLMVHSVYSCCTCNAFVVTGAIWKGILKYFSVQIIQK